MSTVPSMKGDGFYDRNSQVQEQLILSGAQLLEQAGAAIPLPAQGPVGLADFGCSEGKNSILCMNRLVAAVRSRRPEQSVLIVHNDLPANNFNQLFANLYPDETGCVVGPGAKTWVLASAASFWESILPPASLHVACCFSAVHWLSAVPAVPAPQGVLFARMEPESRRILAQQAARDWRQFLEARAAELVPGGRLVVVMGGRLLVEGRELVAGMHLYALLEELLEADPQLRGGRFVMPIYYRSQEELLAPIEAAESPFRLDHCQVKSLSTPFAQQFELDADCQAYAAALTGFVRAWLEPVLQRGLGTDPEAMERIFQAMQARVQAEPAAHPLENVQITACFTRH